MVSPPASRITSWRTNPLGGSYLHTSRPSQSCSTTLFSDEMASRLQPGSSRKRQRTRTAGQAWTMRPFMSRSIGTRWR
jgi:hypothetical protein